MGSEVALSCMPLGDLPRSEFPYTHEQVTGYARGMVIVSVGGCVGGPVPKLLILSPGTQGVVAATISWTVRISLPARRGTWRPRENQVSPT